MDRQPSGSELVLNNGGIPTYSGGMLKYMQYNLGPPPSYAIHLDPEEWMYDCGINESQAYDEDYAWRLDTNESMMHGAVQVTVKKEVCSNCNMGDLPFPPPPLNVLTHTPVYGGLLCCLCKHSPGIHKTWCTRYNVCMHL